MTSPTTEMKKVQELNEMEVTGEYTGMLLHFYWFNYNNVDEKWHSGEIFPIDGNQQEFEEGKGTPMSFWTVGKEKEDEMRQMTSLLQDISSDALMQPVFCVYNHQIAKLVVVCTPCTSEFVLWISNQKPIPLHKYIPVQGKHMISSVLSLANTLWKKGFVCTGLADPKNYRMMETKLQVVPFVIRKKQAADNEMKHRMDFAMLLERELYPKWKDPDLMEFIILLRDPRAKLVHLLYHPLLLPPEKRLALYQTLWPPNGLSHGQLHLLLGLPSFGNWTSTIKPDDDLYGALNHKDKDGNISIYRDSPAEAFRFARDMSSHFMKV